MPTFKKDGYTVSIKQIKTSIPGWYDTGYLEKKNITPESGAYIRSRVTVKSKHIRDGIYKEEQRLHKLYGNKVRLFVVPRLEASEQQDLVLKGETDKQLVASYVASTFSEDSRYSAKATVSYLSSRLKQLRVAVNFRSVQFLKSWANHVLSFKAVKVPYKGQGLVLLRGENQDWPKRSNGAGKTNTLSLLPVPLFGITLKKQKHDDWAREGIKETADANLLMRINRKQKVLVTRTRRPHSLKLIINGKDMSSGIRSSGKQETQGLIEEVLGFDMRLLLNSVYLDQTIANSFVFGTQKDRMDIVEKLLQIERFDDAVKAVNKDISHTSKTSSKLHDDLELLEGDIAELEQQLDDVKSQVVTDWEKKANKARKEVSKLRLVKVSLTQLKTTYEEKQAELDELEVTIESAHTRLAKLSADLNYWLLQKKRSYDFIQRGQCSQCGQPTKKVGRMGLVEAKNKIPHYENKIHIAKKGLSKLVQQQLLLQRSISKYENSVYESEVDLRAARYTLNDIEQGELEEKKRNATFVKQRDELSAKLATKVRIFKAAERAYERAQIDLEMLEYAKHAFSRSGLPLYLAATMCPSLNASADGYSEMMFDDQIKLRFAVEEGKFITDAVNTSGSEQLNGQSTGESAMLGLIAALSVRDQAPKTNLLVIDEPGAGLDSEGARMLGDALIKLKNKFETIIVTTHNPAIESALSGEKSWIVQKKNGISTLYA